MKVCDKFCIDEDALYQKAERSEYWENAQKFYQEVKNKDVRTLSHSQKQWLTQIEYELDENVN